MLTLNRADRCGKDYPASLRYSVLSYARDFNRGALPDEDFVEFGRDIKNREIDMMGMSRITPCLNPPFLR